MRAYKALGDYEKSFEILFDNVHYRFGESVAITVQKIYEEKGYASGVKAIAELYMKSYEESYMLPTDIAYYYALASGQPEEILKLLELGFEINDPGMPYVACKAYPIDFIRDDPRFIELLRKMNLPLE
jgi:hypothetical protein